MADKAPVIVIKKITNAAAGGHGGSWKVAFADFMTALMAFFLLMWLLAQAPETKKAVSDYFSTPSVIEYNFSNYGVELTLEKLFLDLLNEPLKVLQDFMQPMDYTPNFLQMGSKNIVMSALSEDLGGYAEGFEVSGDTIEMKFPESKLFEDGSATPRAQFVQIMDKLSKFTAGLEDANIYVDSRIYLNSVRGQNEGLAQRTAEKRLDLVLAQVDGKLEHQSVSLHSKVEVKPGTRRSDGRPEEGYIRVQIKQKELLSDGTKPRKLGQVMGKDDESMNVYNNFVNKMSTAKPKKKQ
ncbi:MAG: chemotaxis protein MotB [Bdellovibrionales bacterium]|nr:chemotaxis protein MotB [Bdellovibrionales bacterium]